MQSIVMLANEIPIVMAPASLVVTLVIIALITAVIRVAKDESRRLPLWTILVLSMLAVTMRIVINQ